MRWVVFVCVCVAWGVFVGGVVGALFGRSFETAVLAVLGGFTGSLGLYVVLWRNGVMYPRRPWLPPQRMGRCSGCHGDRRAECNRARACLYGIAGLPR